jgi:sigma-B regulation protein RsbU (phosphoserine phosphatase)
MRTRKLAFVNAGQVRPMLLRSGSGEVERLDGGGFPVGLLDISAYDQCDVMLQPGDAVLCLSDGISEATNARNEMWTESEVETIVQTCRGLTARQMVDRLVEATDRFAGEAKQADDMTVVVVRVD